MVENDYSPKSSRVGPIQAHMNRKELEMQMRLDINTAIYEAGEKAQGAKRNAELKAQNAKDDALVAKIMVAMDAKYGHLLDRSDLNQIIKETKP